MTVLLMYHGVGDEVAAHAELRYTVSAANFAKQIKHLSRCHPVVPLPMVVEGQAPMCAVGITFDDGERSVYEIAFPLMRELGLVGTVYVTTGWIGQPGYLTAEQLVGLDRAGWVIGAHGVTHRYLSDLSDHDLQEELEGSRADLDRILGKPTRHMSLPGGRADARVVKQVKQAGFRSLGLSTIGPIPGEPDPFALPRIMVQRTFCHKRFAALARGSRLALARLGLRQKVLDSAKKALGNRVYDRVRGLASQR